MNAMRIVQALLIAWSTVALAQTRPAGAERAKEVGSSFVRHLSKEQFADAGGMVDNSVKAAISPDVLRSVWTDLSKGKGHFKEVGPPTVVDLKSFQWVLVPCEWAQGRIRLKVVLNPQLKVIGLFVVPPAVKSVGVRPKYLNTSVTTREVTVGNKPWELPGTLTLPRDRKPLAAVIMVQGSGPSDRDETIGPNKPFRDLALGLAGAGIASLRYEKRTYHYKAMMALNLSDITVDQEVIEDALLGLTTLRAQPEVAGVPVYVLGHSLGGMLAPEIAAKDGRVAGAILLAAPARSMQEIVVEQLRYLASLSPGSEADAQVDKTAREIERLKKHEAKPDEKILSAPASYWYDLARRDGQTALKTAAGLKARLLVIQGGRDYQSTSGDLKLWQAGLARHPDTTLKLFPDLNHLFASGEGKATPGEYTDETHVDPRVIELIGGWCAKSQAQNGATASGPNGRSPR
jgi:uncharacterized protein